MQLSNNASFDVPPPLHGCPERAAVREVVGRTVRFETCAPQLFPVIDHLSRMARHDVTLLLVGETGTGKTTLAKLVHELSPRFDQPLVTVACGAMPAELVESELFGHVKGAFTGADQDKAGKFAAAQGGTLLLDEIDVLSLDQQAKLLRVIESGEYEPVGSNDTQHANTRLIAASNRDLKQLLADDLFRSDLYYRLNVLEFRLPPLRERREDIELLARKFITELCETHQVSIHTIDPSFFETLKSFPWPGNLRELKNHIRRAVLFCQQGLLHPRDLALETLQQSKLPIARCDEPLATTNLARLTSDEQRFAGPVRAANPVVSPAMPQTLSERVASSEREILESALSMHNQNRTKTAEYLGISRVGLYKKMRRFGMLKPRNEAADDASGGSEQR